MKKEKFCKILALCVLVIALCGCKMLRSVDEQSERNEQTQVSSTNKDTNETISRKTTITEEGGSISTDLIPRDNRYDEITGLYKSLVETFKDGGLTKTVYYKPDGSASVHCETDGKIIETIEKIDRKQSEANQNFDIRLSEIEKRHVESEKETKGLNLNIIAIALIGAAFLFFDKKF